MNQEFFASVRLSAVTLARKFRMSPQRELFATAAHLHLAAKGRGADAQLARTNGGDAGVQTVHERLTAFTASLIRFYNHEANHSREHSADLGGLYELPTRALLSAATSRARARPRSLSISPVVSRRALTTFALIFLIHVYNAKTPRQSTVNSLEEIEKGRRRGTRQEHFCIWRLFGNDRSSKATTIKSISYLYSH